MTSDHVAVHSYLMELYRITQGDLAAQASMFDVGSAMGLNKDEASRLAEDLIGRGWVEIKTLSGGIGITADGIEAARQSGAPTEASGLKLTDAPVLDDTGRQAVEKILADIKTCLPELKSNYDGIEEMVIDIKTAEVQLLSPKAKTAIFRGVLRSLKSTLVEAGSQELASRLESMIEQ